ncbi:glycosyltransferase [Mycetocola sp. 2940]|uniref:glycosyltransferase n=1 Tax=Mycetocola sp. 2940 TaxID=3156452 RepID=UPI0033999A48
MKVVQIVNTLGLSDGGPARNSFELNLALNRLGVVDADLVWINGHLNDSVVMGYPGRLPTPGPRKLGLRGSTRGRAIALGNLIRAIRRADVVILHGYFLAWVPVVAAICRVNAVPFVITPHGSLTSHQAKAARLKKQIFEVIVGSHVRRWCAQFVTGSPIEAQELLQAFPEASVGVGGVGTSLPSLPERSVAASSGMSLLSLSRIAPKKRIDLMIDAMRALKDLGHDAELVIAGVGDARLTDELRRQSQRLGVDRSVRFVGQVHGDAKERLFAGADIFLLPSDDENFGIGLAEALAHGLPCITSDRVAAAEAMSSATGRVLSTPTGESIAQAVLELHEGSNLGIARIAARRDAEREFSWDSVALKWERQLLEATRK